MPFHDSAFYSITAHHSIMLQIHSAWQHLVSSCSKWGRGVTAVVFVGFKHVAVMCAFAARALTCERANALAARGGHTLGRGGLSTGWGRTCAPCSHAGRNFQQQQHTVSLVTFQSEWRPEVACSGRSPSASLHVDIGSTSHVKQQPKATALHAARPS